MAPASTKEKKVKPTKEKKEKKEEPTKVAESEVAMEVEVEAPTEVKATIDSAKSTKEPKTKEKKEKKEKGEAATSVSTKKGTKSKSDNEPASTLAVDPSPKSKSKAKGKGKGKDTKAPAPEPEPQVIDEEDAEEEWEDSIVSNTSDGEEDSEDDGVDEEGLARLMKALGDDGLDEFDRAQLGMLADEDDGDEAEGDDGDEDEDEGADDAEDGEDAEEQIVDDEEASEDSDIPLDELDQSLVVDPDTVPSQKIVINNTHALSLILDTIRLDPSLPFTETLVTTYPNTHESIDPSDDLKRELSFYAQALHSANLSRTLAQKCGLPFTRPSDYFAEMVKSDSHMERIRMRLLDESSVMKKSEEKRREREGKKFGKAVQVEKLKEREKSKKDMEERVKNLKRSQSFALLFFRFLMVSAERKDILDNAGGGQEDFDVAVEDAISDRPSKKAKSAMPRPARDQKFGYGGAKRNSKQNTKESTDSFGPRAGRGGGKKFGAGGPGKKFGDGGPGKKFGGGGGAGRGAGGGRGAKAGGGNKRPGKSRRAAGQGKK